MKKINVYGIVWDDAPHLPKDVTIEVTDAEYEEFANDPDLLVDKLSDEFGYCIESYESDDMLTDED